MLGRSDLLRTVVILMAAVLVAVWLVWAFTGDADAQGVCETPCRSFCRGLDHRSPERAPWHLEESERLGADRCWCYCCDVTYTYSWQVSIPLPRGGPTATRRPSTATPRPTQTATVPPTATAIPVTATATATVTRVNTPIATATPAPTETAVFPTATPVPPTATPAPIPAPATKSVAPPETVLAQPADPGRACIPAHAAAPVRLVPDAIRLRLVDLRQRYRANSAGRGWPPGLRAAYRAAAGRQGIAGVRIGAPGRVVDGEAFGGVDAVRGRQALRVFGAGRWQSSALAVVT